jgi:arylsulfatase A-like enzyme
MKRSVALLSLLVLGCATVVAAAEKSDKPNIVLILADDFGWGSLGCYGAPDELKTPNLDRLAEEGRRFTQAYAPGSVCSPTRYGLMTGRYYWRTNIKDGKVLSGSAPLHIETDRLTLASLCKSQGYKTAAFGKWHLGLTTERVTDWARPLRPGPLQIGFDHFFGMAANLGNGPHSFIVNEEVSGHVPGAPITVRGGARAVNGTTGVEKNWKPEEVMTTLTEIVTEWIEANHERPFFVYYALNAVHEPILPHPRFKGSPYGGYGDFIHELDSSIGQILETLDRLKLADNTLIIFTSDNGGVVNPRNKNASAAIVAGLAINGPLRGGKHSEWEGGFREPFLVRWPGKVPASSVSDQVICLTDMVATFAALFQVPLPKGSAEDSFDVLRTLTETEPGPPVRDHVILQAANAVYDIRMGDWKFVERQDAPEFESLRNPRKAGQAARQRAAAANQQNELFNLREDPSEKNNVWSSNRARGKRMKRALDDARDRGFTRAGAG